MNERPNLGRVAHRKRFYFFYLLRPSSYIDSVIARMNEIIARLRALAKAPGFSCIVIAILALGIGVSATFFSVVDAVLLQPLKFDTAGRIVAIQTVGPIKGRIDPRISGGDFIDLRSAARCFSAVAIYSGGELGVQIGGRSRFARTFKTDPSFFSVLDIPTIAGRLPSQNNATQTAVVTASFARASWGSTETGKTLNVENKPYTVVGVVNDGYAFPEGSQVWITGPNDPENQSHAATKYRAIGRLRPGLSLRQAQAELERLREQDKTFRVLSLRDDVAGPARTTLLFLFVATALLLLIACANVANLMLTRTAQRSREIAIRMSLGSSFGQLIRLIAADSFILAGTATLVGIVIAYAAVHVLYPLLPASLPRSAEVLHMHPAVLIFAFLACCCTVLACSLAPAFYLRRVSVADVLKQSSRGLVGGGLRTRHMVVAAQVALCCVLCIGAVLLSRTLLALTEVPLGFHPGGVTVMYADAPAFELPEYMRAIRTFEAAIDDIRRMPGVRSAAAIMGLPTGRYVSNGAYVVEGATVQFGQDPMKMGSGNRALPYANFAVATGSYFKTVGIPLLAGRDFDNRDQYGSPFTAIISRSLAQQAFGSVNPIGRRISCSLDSPKPMTIVGIVGDVRQNSPASSLQPEIYMPFRQHPYYANELQIVARTDSDPRKLIRPMRRVMQKAAPGVAISFTTLPQMVSDSIAAPRFRAVLTAAFAALAGVLAMTGIYAVMLFHVSRQRVEIGLRIALGATPASIMGLVIRQAFTMSSAGLLVGIGMSVGLSRFVSGLVYGVKVLDLATYCLGAAAVVLLTALAAAGPTLRASRVDPAIALRND